MQVIIQVLDNSMERTHDELVRIVREALAKIDIPSSVTIQLDGNQSTGEQDSKSESPLP